MSGANVIVTTGGANISFEVEAHVVKAIPEDARFVLASSMTSARRPRSPGRWPRPRAAGITWETVIALIAAALFAGGFIGNVFASKRRPAPRASVYDAVQRRVETRARRQGRSRRDRPDVYGLVADDVDSSERRRHRRAR